MKLAGATLFINGEPVPLRDARFAFPPALNSAAGLKRGAFMADLVFPSVSPARLRLSELVDRFVKHLVDEHRRKVAADLDFTARRGAALRQIGRAIWANRKACNFAVMRELANQHLLWSRGEHYYRDMAPGVIAREFSGESAP